MTLSNKKKEYGVQKEWYYIKDGKGIGFVEIKDVPFDIDEGFKIRFEGNLPNIGQIVKLHPVDENMAWNIITREYDRRYLRLTSNNVVEDKSSKKNKLTLQNIENIRDELAEGKIKVIRYSSSYFITGEGREIPDEKRKLIRYLRKLGVRAEGKRYLDAKMRNRLITGSLSGLYLDPESTSYLVPINHGYLLDENGTYYGRCDLTGAPIFLDRSTLPSSHELVAGMTGFGKSYFVKATMLREKVSRKIDVKIIDPLGEYNSLASSIGGTSVDILNMEINIFEKVDFLSIKENVDRTISLLATLFDLSNEDLGILDTGLTMMYERNLDTEFLKDFIERKSQEVYNKISPIFDGSLKKFCKGRNPLMDGDVRIDLSKIPRKLLPFYMLLSLDILIRGVRKNESVIVIDEAHYLLQDEVVGSLERYVRHARHNKVSLIMISQSANDFLKNRSALSIMENCSIHVLFRHQVVSEEIVKFYKLDENLSNFLRNSAGFNGKYSKALLVTPSFSTLMRFESSEEEKNFIEGFHKGQKNITDQ
ncbi:MAG: ATP-binding protein [Thermoplasmatales archaeon]